MAEGLEQLKALDSEVLCIKNAMLRGKGIDILLYLAKYNPGIPKKDIVEKFGKNSLGDLKELEDCKLVKESEEKLSLTNEGIFQVEGLLSIVA